MVVADPTLEAHDVVGAAIANHALESVRGAHEAIEEVEFCDPTLVAVVSVANELATLGLREEGVDLVLSLDREV